MANEQNLNPFGTLTEKEQREISSKGGKASVESRKTKKLLRECLQELLDKEMTDKSGNTKTGAEAMAVAVFAKALKGDLKAFEIVRDTAGQKPIEQLRVQTDVDIISSAERLNEIFQQIEEEK